MTVSENPSTSRFLWPAEYYSGPLRPPVLPQWAPFGCGAAAVVVLILVFAGGAFLSSGGFIDVMDFAIGMSASEMRGYYAAEVTAAQRKALDDEVALMLKNFREEKISVVQMQPFLESLRNASGDRNVTAPEAESLQAIVRRINARAKSAKPAKPFPASG